MQTITPEIALQALRETWSHGGPLAYVSGPITLKDPEADILHVLDESRKQPVTPPQLGDLPNFAYTDFGTPTAGGRKESRDARRDAGALRE